MEDQQTQNKIVQILSGEDSIKKLLDDVFETLKDTGGEVFISGIDERKFLEANREVTFAHLERLRQHGIGERLLAREGDTFFLPGEQSKYRWVPENLFNPALIYVYDNKIAMIVWGHPEQVIIITNATLADAYRKHFIFIWERAIIPPTKQGTEDERKRLEQAIIKRFGGRITYITDKDKQLFRDFLQKEKIETYGNSFYYICQAANGIGEQKLGLKYFDGETLIAIGIFNRTSLGGGWHYFLNRPLGKFDSIKLANLASKLLELSSNPVYIKKVTTEQKEALLKTRFFSIEDYPWHAQAMEEDDTYPEQIIDVEKVFWLVKGQAKSNLKKQYTYFMSKVENQRIEFVDLNENNSKDASWLVQKFFQYLEVKALHISQPTDLDNIISHPPLGKSWSTYFSQIMYIDRAPVGFFAMEPISKDTVGLYASIALHQEYPNASEYLIVHCCEILKSAGYRFLNLGGSETSGLFQFKEKFSPVAYNKMHWVVYKYD